MPAQPNNTPAAQAAVGLRAQVTAAARKYGIDPNTLWGVFGQESDYGKNLGPSSAGAQGPMQFLLATARRFGVNPTDKNWNDDFEGAARYLKQLGADGDINSARTAAALNRYSGGGGATYVKGVRSHAGSLNNPQGPVGAIGDLPGDAAAAAGSAVDAVTPDFLKKLGVIFHREFWLRFGLALGGAALVVLGFVMIAKQYLPKGMPLPIPL